MSYGAKSNDDLVMYYGFVEPDAAADVFEFGDMLAWLQGRRAGVVNDDRLQTMYSKGLQDAVRCVDRLIDRSCRVVDWGRVVGVWQPPWLRSRIQNGSVQPTRPPVRAWPTSRTHTTQQGVQDRARGPGGGREGAGGPAGAAGLGRGAAGGERHHGEHHPDAHVPDHGRVRGLGLCQGRVGTRRGGCSPTRLSCTEPDARIPSLMGSPRPTPPLHKTNTRSWSPPRSWRCTRRCSRPARSSAPVLP